jgi:hypothetical protein
MPDNTPVAPKDDYRLVLIDSTSMRLFSVKGTGGYLLPRLSIPTYARIAEAINDVIVTEYGFCSIQLALFPGVVAGVPCAVHEIINTSGALNKIGAFHSLAQIAASELTDDERCLLTQIMNGQASELGRFARLGWITELIDILGYGHDRDCWPVIRQLNQSIDFCLLSMISPKGKKTWFKAVGEPNTREYVFTTELAHRFPKLLPRILGTIPGWNAWLAEDVQGIPLNETHAIRDCQHAFAALGEMQTNVAHDSSLLRDLETKDWTFPQVSSYLEAFFADAQLAMNAQVVTSPERLSSRQLCKLQHRVQSALREVAEIGIPSTLVHGDIGHGNVIATSRGPVFLDWAETYQGHPFVCSEHLLADLSRSDTLFAINQSSLRTFYAQQWHPWVNAGDLARAATLAPALAAFVCALVGWHGNRNRPDSSRTQPFIRSMVRRTKREFEELREVSV